MATRAAKEQFPSLITATIEDVAEGLRRDRFTTVQLVKAYLARIEEAKQLNAVAQINPDALAIAQALDEERQRGGARKYVPLSVLCSCNGPRQLTLRFQQTPARDTNTSQG